MQTALQKDALTETYNDMKNLINKAAWDFYRRYGGDFEEWRAEANLAFIETYNSYKKHKGQFSTWLYFRIRKNLLNYHRALYKQSPKTSRNRKDEDEDAMENLEDEKRHHFSSLEFFDGIGDDTTTLILLIWNLPNDLPISNGPNSCHTKVSLRKYLRDAGWTWERIKESFEEISRIINE